MEPCRSVIAALRHGHKFVHEIYSGQPAAILVNQTCFYAEQGGQSYDKGYIKKVRDEVVEDIAKDCTQY